ncbi:MAG: ankyrin repeat domain-containing protein [Archangiaceae bacterium]|nr:ankyrin repeat domain-containing protein [Archangiaceae bacterium]
MTLFEAVQSRDAEALEKLAAEAKDLNEEFEGGRTALIEAAATGQLDLVKILLEAGADPSLKDFEKETALLKAAANGELEVVHALAPMATEDERDLARAFLKAHGKSFSPEYQGPADDFGKLKRAAATASARVSKFVGHDSPSERLARVERSEQNAKKKK